MAERPGRQRLLEAVARSATGRGLDPEVPVELARAAVRRVDDHELRRHDLDRLADQLVAGARLLADRAHGEIALSAHRDGDGTVVQVATDDHPFLLSTVLEELDDDHHHVRLRLHPIVGTERDADGRLLQLLPARGAEHRESLLHLLVAPPLDDPDAVAARLRELVGDVQQVTGDHADIRAALRWQADHLRTVHATVGPGDGADPADDPGEVAALLDWLLDDHAVLLGTRRYRLLDEHGVELADGGGRATHLHADPSSGTGLLADSSTSRWVEPTPLAEVAVSRTGDVTALPRLTWSRSRRRSTVQRQVRTEHLALTEHDEQGRVVAVLGVLLLFTRRGEDARADATPVLRRRLADVLAADDVVPGSHDDVVLTELFQAIPKDELFPLTVEQVRELLTELHDAEERREVRTWMRIDEVTRTVSVVVAAPRDGYSPQLRERLTSHLRERFAADRVDVAVALADRGEAVARYLLTLEHDVPAIPAAELEGEVRDLARDWITEVRELLITRDGPADADRLVTELARRLPRSYRDQVDPALAAADLHLLDRATNRPDALAIGWHRDEERGRWRLRVVAHGQPVELSAFLPVVESLGLTVVDEVPYRLAGGEPLHLHDVGVRVGKQLDRALADATARDRASATLQAAWRGHAEVDGLAQLVLLADIDWRDVGVLRAYRRYRRQLGSPHTPAYVEEILVGNAPATAALLGRFRARFDPDVRDRNAAVAAADDAFETAMGEVAQLDADRVLRGLSALIDATVRTNAFRDDARGDDGEPYVALKLDPARVPGVPAPVPHREVFVHSPRVEGVHLRGGPVARGGLRWSDRRDDVRTEVLGLVKAQVLKNALIVPTGAKGGFVLGRPPDDADQLRAEVARQYVTFVRGLLDVTDDLAADDGGSRVVPPPRVVRHDGDDPYLVVAADKGTATFSDTANEVAARYGFWLGDAFASGGSAGYDHKALGVTAKGAWRAVARHFRELGVDVDVDPITVAGIGDLSGDVFSNGLLRSRVVRLVAAFDHRHVFLDPDPDPEASFDERARVAGLGRSSWDDYDRKLLSPGGMIVPRDVRAVTLTDEVRELLRLDVAELAPPDLIRAILTAPVDLLWAGGIGTYVKASTERHDEVGDRANDEVRVDADQVRARVVGEGANLSLTQRARIELARRGARVDQDAIHNAAGVATSDAEVNVKILLDVAIAEGRLAAEDRDATLASYADDVVAHVLDAVDRQVAALSAERDRTHDQIVELEAFMARLEDAGLDRQVEVLPDTAELQARAEAGGGLTRPELATLLAWAKRELKEALLASDAPDEPVLADAVTEPFPASMVAAYGDLLDHHRLRRELIATAVANTCVDRLGITFASGLAHETGLELPTVATAVQAAVAVVDARRWWRAVEELEGTVPPDRVRELADTVDGLVRATVVGLLDDPRWASDPIEVRDGVRAVAVELTDHAFEIGSTVQRRARRAHARWLVDDLVEPELAAFLACAQDLAAAPDVAHVRAVAAPTRTAAEVADVAARVSEVLGLEQLDRELARAAAGDGWSRRQHRGIAQDLRRLRRDAAAAVLRAADDDVEPARAVTGFLADRRRTVDRARRTVTAVVDEHAGADGVAVAARTVRVVLDG